MNPPLRRFPIIIVSHRNTRIFYSVFFYQKRNLNLYYFSFLGKHEALGCWYLEMWRQKLPYHRRWRCLDLFNHCCSLSPICHQKIERNEGLVKNVLYFYSVRRACQQKRVNKKRIKEVWFSTNSFSNPSSKCAITHRYLSQWSGRLNSVQKIAAPSKKCLKVHYLVFSVSFCPHLKIFHAFFGHRMDKTQKCWLTFCGFLANFIL